MDSFINLAKEGFQAYERSQSGDINKTGGAEYNAPSHSQRQGSDSPDIDDETAVRHATQSGSGDSSLFSTALGHVKSNTDAHHQPVDEEHVQRAHQQAYSQGDASNLSSDSLGSAAALQALKNFTSGGGSSGGGNTQSQLIGMAMSEASSLFDSLGGASSGKNKQEVVNSAAMTVMKLLVKSKFSGAIGGGDSGGLGGLMSLANKFI